MRYVITFRLESGPLVIGGEAETPVSAVHIAFDRRGKSNAELRITDRKTGIEYETSAFAKAHDLSVAIDDPAPSREPKHAASQLR